MKPWQISSFQHIKIENPEGVGKVIINLRKNENLRKEEIVKMISGTAFWPNLKIF